MALADYLLTVSSVKRSSGRQGDARVEQIGMRLAWMPNPSARSLSFGASSSWAGRV